MNPAAGGAADPPSSSTSAADNSAGRRRRQQRAPSPARAQEAASKRAPRHPGRSRSPLPAERSRNVQVRESRRSADGRERELESRGAAAVHPDGAEADLVGPNRADAVEEHPTDSSTSARRSVLRLPCLRGDHSQRLLPGRASPSFSAEEKGKKPGEKSGRGDRSGAAAGCGTGLGLGLWRGGCLQAELIQFHLHKRLKRGAARMQTKADNTGAEEAAQPAAEATEAGSVTQQDQAYEDEMERLLEENEDLKV